MEVGQFPPLGKQFPSRGWLLNEPTSQRAVERWRCVCSLFLGTMTQMPLPELVDAVRDLLPRGRDRVQSALEGLSVRPSSLQPYLFFRRNAYTRNLVFRDDAFELVVLCWDGGTRSPVHGHADQECFFLVQQGSFRIDNFALLEGGRAPGLAHLEHEGTILNVGARMVDHRSSSSDIHRVSLMPGISRAVSVHVYARPIDRFLVYDVPGRRARWGYSRYHSVNGVWHAPPGVQHLGDRDASTL